MVDQEMNDLMTEEEKTEQIKTEIITDKKCPNCAATLVYDPETKGMLCSYCGFTKVMPQAAEQAPVQEMSFEEAKARASYDWGTAKKMVVCQNCSGTSIYDALETAAICPFCGSTHVMPAVSNESIAPGGVCPFEIPMKRAGELFTRWLKGRIFTPSEAKRQAKPEAFTGIYLPYWTFDAMTHSKFQGQAGYDKRVKKGDSYEIETTWKNVAGEYDEFIDDQMIVGSKRHEDSGIKKAEPFDFAKLVPYNPELIAGFIAERYSIGLDEAWQNAQGMIHNRLTYNIEGYIRQAWRADRAGKVAFSTIFSKITYKYILVPVWVSSFTYKGKSYQFVVNGQTGKVGGKAPISPIRVALAILGVLGLIALFLTFVNM